MIDKRQSATQQPPASPTGVGSTDVSPEQDTTQSSDRSLPTDQTSSGKHPGVSPAKGKTSLSSHAPGSDHTSTEIVELTEQLEKCQSLLAAAKEEKQRSLADYQNLQRRTMQERTQMAKLATQALVGDLLEHFDHLSMAAEHTKDPALSMIVQQLWQTLNDHGLTEIDAQNKHFDPQLMEAVSLDQEGSSTAESDKTPDDSKAKVSKVVQRGYTLHGVLLRPAKVLL